MRDSMLEVLGRDFIELARAKGLKSRVIMLRHAARNALLGVVTIAGIMVGFAVGGQVVVEALFSWPGMGQLMVESAPQSRLPRGPGHLPDARNPCDLAEFPDRCALFLPRSAHQDHREGVELMADGPAHRRRSNAGLIMIPLARVYHLSAVLGSLTHSARQSSSGSRSKTGRYRLGRMRPPCRVRRLHAGKDLQPRLPRERPA